MNYKDADCQQDCGKDLSLFPFPTIRYHIDVGSADVRR